MAALTRRRDLTALPDRHTLLGPEQAALRLSVRRTEVDHLTRLWPDLDADAEAGRAGMNLAGSNDSV
ncbi:hypothetical protein [Streptomyces sp. NPDC048603]|uniref:hypothetical protein n=1 Tax=Streptomyces sp. NPDC048603 TaxID=3365577 RepID=UPI003716F3D2